MADGPQDELRGRSKKSGREQRTLANESRLIALGETVDSRAGVPHKNRPPHRASRRKRNLIITGALVIILLVGLIGGSYLYAQYRFGSIPKLNVKYEIKPIAGQPFNVLEIGSDSRAGLTGLLARQTGASSGQVSGQRSDVVKIMHVDPNAGTITILSIPRDTTVTLLANQKLFGKYNRINVNFGNGPSLLARTITANFGIPINYTVEVSFAGLINAAEAIGGVYLNFPYPAHDSFSDLRIMHAGCQLIDGPEALAVVRSRHYYYNIKGLNVWPKNAINLTYAQLAQYGWTYDGTSDYGRIGRQNAFIRAMIDRVKGSLGNPIAMNNFISKMPQGILIDNKFSLNQMMGLALKFRHFNPAAMKTYTLSTYGATVNGNDLLFVQQPYAQQMLINIFGSQLLKPTNPPPNAAFQTPPPPVIPTTTTLATTLATTTAFVMHSKQVSISTTATTNPALTVPSFDPVPCTPK